MAFVGDGHFGWGEGIVNGRGRAVRATLAAPDAWGDDAGLTAERLEALQAALHQHLFVAGLRLWVQEQLGITLHSFIGALRRVDLPTGQAVPGASITKRVSGQRWLTAAQRHLLEGMAGAVDAAAPSLPLALGGQGGPREPNIIDAMMKPNPEHHELMLTRQAAGAAAIAGAAARIGYDIDRSLLRRAEGDAKALPEAVPPGAVAYAHVSATSRDVFRVLYPKARLSDAALDAAGAALRQMVSRWPDSIVARLRARGQLDPGEGFWGHFNSLGDGTIDDEGDGPVVCEVFAKAPGTESGKWGDFDGWVWPSIWVTLHVASDWYDTVAESGYALLDGRVVQAVVDHDATGRPAAVLACCAVDDHRSKIPDEQLMIARFAVAWDHREQATLTLDDPDLAEGAELVL